MKSVINLISWIGLLVTFFVALAFSFYWRFTNIDMTETRLFFTYWKEYAVMLFFVVIFGWAHMWSKDE